jgi:C_GCAxxG_C_C family probable redox protein
MRQKEERMSTRVEEARKRHEKGYNCAQAVACTYCDLAGVSEDEMFRITEGYGLGMGCMQGVCGAVSGAVALAGAKNSIGCDNTMTKKATYQLSAEILDRFQKKNGSFICKELKGVDTGKVLRSCPGCIQDAAELAEEILFKTELADE